MAPDATVLFFWIGVVAVPTIIAGMYLLFTFLLEKYYDYRRTRTGQ